MKRIPLRRQILLTLRTAGRVAAVFSGVLASVLILIALMAWIGAMIPRNSDWSEPPTQAGRNREIMVGTNGVHTEIVMPLVTPERDWHSVFPASDLAAADRPYTHVAVSWGERRFFLATPTWSDVRLSTAIGALTGGDAVLHVTHYVRPAPSPDYRTLRLRPHEYRALADAITAQTVDQPDREVIPGYGENDVFYTARGTYHIGNTCNQWTSDQLAAAGVRTGWWTPLAGGVMRWVPTP